MDRQPTRYDATMLRVMNRREYARWHETRGRRAAWTAIHVVLTAAVPAVFALSGGSGLLLLALLVPLTLAWCVCTGVLNSATRGLLELRARVLDERQLAERGRAYTTAHRVQSALLVVGLGALLLGERLSDESVGVGTVLAVLFALLLTHWLLPLWFAVLRTADEPEDDPVAAQATHA